VRSKGRVFPLIAVITICLKVLAAGLGGKKRVLRGGKKGARLKGALRRCVATVGEHVGNHCTQVGLRGGTPSGALRKGKTCNLAQKVESSKKGGGGVGKIGENVAHKRRFTGAKVLAAPNWRSPRKGKVYCQSAHRKNWSEGKKNVRGKRLKKNNRRRKRLALSVISSCAEE